MFQKYSVTWSFCLNVGLEKLTWAAIWFEVLSRTAICTFVTGNKKARPTDISVESWDLEGQLLWNLVPEFYLSRTQTKMSILVS